MENIKMKLMDMIETFVTLTIKVVLPSEVTIATFKRAGEPCLMFSPGITGFTRLGRGDFRLRFFAEVFVS